MSAAVWALYEQACQREGVVDFAYEPRYGKGTKSIAERFKPGDLVRVRLASDRPHAEGELAVRTARSFS